MHSTHAQAQVREEKKDLLHDAGDGGVGAEGDGNPRAAVESDVCLHGPPLLRLRQRQKKKKPKTSQRGQGSPKRHKRSQTSKNPKRATRPVFADVEKEKESDWEELEENEKEEAEGA